MFPIYNNHNQSHVCIYFIYPIDAIHHPLLMRTILLKTCSTLTQQPGSTPEFQFSVATQNISFCSLTNAQIFTPYPSLENYSKIRRMPECQVDRQAGLETQRCQMLWCLMSQLFHPAAVSDMALAYYLMASPRCAWIAVDCVDERT